MSKPNCKLNRKKSNFNTSKSYNIRTHKEQTRYLQIIYSHSSLAIYSPILELNEPQGDSPTQTSRHTIVRQEIHIFSKSLNAIREDLSIIEITQYVKHDLQKILPWFITNYFCHNIDLIEQARKNFRLENTDDETVLAELSDYFWDPDWSHDYFINVPTDISNQATSKISIHKDYSRVYLLTVDATPLDFNSIFPERTGNKSLNSTFINHDNLNGTRNLTQQDIKTPLHFVNEEIVETITTTEAQRSISPIQPNFTAPKVKHKKKVKKTQRYTNQS